MITRRIALPFLTVTAVICGMLIMVIEILGSRVMGPFFGVSLFVWTSLIAVTMIALAAGYLIGGILADRAKSPDPLYLLIALAGVCTFIIPYIKIPVLKLCLAFGLRLGAFSGSLVLFAPALTFLGCVSPFVIKLSALEVKNVGRTVGSFYALSTIGSVLGTVLTGFIFIAYLGVNNIFFLVGALLLALSIYYFTFHRGKQLTVAILLPLCILPVMAPSEVNSMLMDDGTRINVVARTDSRYGNIKVLDYDEGQSKTRRLVIDGLDQGVVDRQTGLSLSGYPYLMEHVPLAINPGGRRCLVIGLGAGIIPAWFIGHGIDTDVVDIDPAVVGMARMYFNYPAGGKVVINDARYFLSKVEHKYDYIILDVFSGEMTPAHLLSREAFDLIKTCLNDRGVFAINLIGSLEDQPLMTLSIIKTLETVFAKTIVIPLYSNHNGRSMGNIAIFAYAANLHLPAHFNIRPGDIHPLAQFQVMYALGQSYLAPAHADAMILTDDYNPIDFYDLKLKEKVRESIIAGNDWDILLN